MKRFARCANCRQWYIHTFTMAVEIYQGSQLQRIAVWCCRCITDAEHRSQPADPQPHVALSSPAQTVPSAHFPTPEDSVAAREEAFVHEHLQLMDRAMREDDAVLVPLIEDFMQRCRAYNDQAHTAEQAKRLQAHLQYWAAFLKALQQSL
jgi:hypothetical protein